MLSKQTPRLTLMALTPDAIIEYLDDRPALFQRLNLVMKGISLRPPYDFLDELEEVLREIVLPGLHANPAGYPAYTHWIIIEDATARCIGGIGCFPFNEEEGTVMMGYFIDADAEGKGYASEAVQGLLDFLWEETGLVSVIADTPPEHIASQKVLSKNGFTRLGEVEEGVRWQYFLDPEYDIHE